MSTAQESTVKSAYQELRKSISVKNQECMTRAIGNWGVLIEYYTTTRLTYASDRLVALAGVIKAIEQRTGFTNVWGTWREFWSLDLLWYYKTTEKRSTRR